MQTKACPNCGAQVASQAVMCPQCKASFAKKKSWPAKHPVVIVFLSLLVIAVGIGVVAAATGEKKTESGEAKPEAKQEEIPTIVDAAAFVAEFDANKISAQDKYNKKVIQTTGWVANISGGDFGGVYIQLNPKPAEIAFGVEMPYVGTFIQCYPEKSDVTDLKNGQQITVKGTVNDMSVGIIQLKDCKVVK